MLTYDALVKLSTEDHANLIMTDLAIGRFACDDAQTEEMEHLRRVLISHLDAAEQRGKNIRDMFTMED